MIYDPGTELAVTNARVVTRDGVIEGGSLLARDGVIAAVEPGKAAVAGAVDFGGDYLMPGLIELHTTTWKSISRRVPACAGRAVLR